MKFFFKKKREIPVQSKTITLVDAKATQAKLDRKLYRAVKKSQIDKVQSLLIEGANPNALSRHGQSAFHKAVRMNASHIASLLLQHGAMIDLQTIQGDTALHFATRNGHLYMMEYVLNHANPNIANHKGNTPLHVAVTGGEDEDLETVQSLLYFFKANPNVKNKKGKAPLHLAAERDEYEMVQELLKIGADINLTTNHCGKTVVHICIEKGCLQILNELLQDADFNVQRKDTGEAALHTAVKEEDLEVLELLLFFGANPDIQNKKGETPLFLSAKNDEYEMTQELLAKGANPNICRTDGTSPLHAAVKAGNIQLVDEIMRGCNLNTQAQGETPLHTAVEDDDIDFLQTLLILGADPNVQNQNGDTPLHCAIRNNSYEMTSELLDEWANPDVRNKDGDNVFDLAKRSGNPALLDLLQVKTAKLNTISNNFSEAAVREIKNYLKNLYSEFLDKTFSLEIYITKLKSFTDRAKEIYQEHEMQQLAEQCVHFLMFYAGHASVKRSHLSFVLTQEKRAFIEAIEELRLKHVQKHTQSTLYPPRKINNQNSSVQFIETTNYPDLNFHSSDTHSVITQHPLSNYQDLFTAPPSDIAMPAQGSDYTEYFHAPKGKMEEDVDQSEVQSVAQGIVDNAPALDKDQSTNPKPVKLKKSVSSSQRFELFELKKALPNVPAEDPSAALPNEAAQSSRKQRTRQGLKA